MKKQTLQIVKIGGKLLRDEAKLDKLLMDFCALKEPKILVHGGGHMATEIASKLGYKTKMIGGRRITDKKSLQVAIMVYAGLINKTLVAKLQANANNAIGLCGADAKSIVSKKREAGAILNYELVGDVRKVNREFIDLLLRQGMVPVFSAISCSEEGILLNTNADSVASALAREMSKDFKTELYYCFEKKGVLTDMDKEDTVIEQLDFNTYKKLMNDKTISNGMIPKLHNCFEALYGGASKVILGNYQLLRKGVVHTKIIHNEI